MTVRDAAVAAMPLSGTVEYGGAILEVRDEFCYTAPVTQSKQTRIAYRVFAEPGARVAALYHTHPAAARLERASRFSAADVAASVQADVVSFVGIAATGDIRVFDPRQVRRASFGARGNFAKASYTPEFMEGHLVAQTAMNVRPPAQAISRTATP